MWLLIPLTFFTKLSEFSATYDNILINADLQRHDSRFKLLLSSGPDLVNRYPTHFCQGYTPSLLDIFSCYIWIECCGIWSTFFWNYIGSQPSFLTLDIEFAHLMTPQVFTYKDLRFFYFKIPCIVVNYSRISILLEKLVAFQVQNHLSVHKLHKYPCQSVFRAHHSCSTEMINIMDNIRIIFDKGLARVLGLLHFSKALDSVAHSLLRWKLQYLFGFGLISVNFIRTFQSNRSQRVISGRSTSSYKIVTKGAP